MAILRRFPPFGKALQARGPGLVLIVPSTRAGWRTAMLHPCGDVLLYEPGRDPGLYEWPVTDSEVVLYTEALDRRSIDRMVQVLERAGATVVHCHEWRPATQAAA